MNYKNTVFSMFFAFALGGTSLSSAMMERKKEESMPTSQTMTGDEFRAICEPLTVVVPQVPNNQQQVNQSIPRFEGLSEIDNFFDGFSQQNVVVPQVSNNQQQVDQDNSQKNNDQKNPQQKLSNKKQIVQKPETNSKQIPQAQNKQPLNVQQKKFEQNTQKSSHISQNKVVEEAKSSKSVNSNKISYKQTQKKNKQQKGRVKNQLVVHLPEIQDPVKLEEAKQEKKMMAWDLFRACTWRSKDLPEKTKGNFVGHVDARDDDGKTPLHHAAKNGLLNMVKSLVEDGADINAQDSNDSIFTNAASKRTALQYAAQNGHIEVVKFLTDHGADISIRDTQGNTLLHYAVGSLKDNSEVIHFVIEKDPASVKATNIGQVTPLHTAALQGNQNSAKILIKNGADVNAKDSEQLSPLQHNIVYHGLNTKKIMKFLVKYGADVNTKFSSDWTPLFRAIQEKDMELIEILVEKGADVHAKDELGNTVLRYAALSSNPKILKFLLKNTDIEKDINIKDGIQGTPLFDACGQGNYENAKILIDYGADVNAKGVRQFIPSTGKLNFRENPYLIKPEIEYFTVSAFIHPQPEEGYAPLHAASLNGHDKIVDLLIENKAFVNIKTNNHVTPMHAAAFGGHVSIVEKLCKAKANIDAETIDTSGGFFEEENHVLDKVTPLFTAIAHGQTEVVKVLAPRANVNHTVGSFKATPLHLASLLGHSEIVETLLEDERTNFKLLLREKHTAADVANHYGKKNIAESLNEKMDHLRRMFTISLSRSNDNKASIKNNGILEKAIISQPKLNIRADRFLTDVCTIKELQIQPSFEFSCSSDNDCVLPGVYYRGKNGQIEPVETNLKTKMVSNHLSNLNYFYCPKMNIPGESEHQFPTTIEKDFGHQACVVIDTKDVDKIGDSKQKFDLYVTMPGIMNRIKNKEGKPYIVSNELGIFEFKVRKSLYESKGSCLHRFFNSRTGEVGAQGFGKEFREKEQKKSANKLFIRLDEHTT